MRRKRRRPLYLLDILLGEAAASGDSDLLLLAGAKILGVDVENAVGVDVKRHIDLRGAARRGWNVGQLEFANALVVVGELAFARARTPVKRPSAR